MDWRGEEEWRKVRYIIGLALDEFELDSREVAVEKALEIMAAGLEKKWGLKGSLGGDAEKTEIGRGGASGSSGASGGPSAHSRWRRKRGRAVRYSGITQWMGCERWLRRQCHGGGVELTG